MGFDALSEAELIALLLSTGASGHPVTLVAPALLERAGGLAALVRAPPLGIAAHPGVGVAKALRLGAAAEIGRRLAMGNARPRLPLQGSHDVARYFEASLAHLNHEEMWLASLDGRNRLRATRRVAEGGLHGCAVTARDVLRVALAAGASSFVLIHNHPSDDPTPSPEDVTMTRLLVAAATTVGVPLVDHVIVSPSQGYRSLLDLGVIPLR